MMATGVHGVDLLRFILGQEVMEVAALTDGQTPKMPLDRVATMCLKFNLGSPRRRVLRAYYPRLDERRNNLRQQRADCTEWDAAFAISGGFGGRE